MHTKNLNDQVSVSDQIRIDDLPKLAAVGIEIIVCNRPDGEASGQTRFVDIATAAIEQGMEAIHIPFSTGEMTNAHRDEFVALIEKNKRIHAYCRTGNRCSLLWAAASKQMGIEPATILSKARAAGFDVATALDVTEPPAKGSPLNVDEFYEIVVVGAGTGGIAVAASLLKRQPDLRIALIGSANDHFYQPGWTMVGAGVFDAASTRRKTNSLIPSGVTWIQHQAVAFDPDNNSVTLDDGRELFYRQLIVAAGLSLNWSAIEGLTETLGQNGVTSNYRYDLAPYTWQLVQGLKHGKAVFTQPPMPIKCAGAPQKALYLSADHWLKQGAINDIQVEFYNAGAVLFGVEAYVPALMSYIEKYHASLHLNHTLTKVDGSSKRAWFTSLNESGEEQITETMFDMLHVCPPQNAPEFIQNSPLADAAGWLDVDQHTLRHKKYDSIWGLGDVTNTPNAKTMAAVRKQAPVVAQNIVDVLSGNAPSVGYDGYGSCPLTVEHGKIVLAEFGYGGKLLPSFPTWINDGTQPTKKAWLLKAQVLPTVYWHGMLKGREWLARPQKLDS